MPASYAHYRFGKLLLPALPADVRQTVQRFRRMYDMGLQGPDFFFYYNPFLKTAIGQLGKEFHRQSGQEFFPAACKAASSEAAEAYLYGLLAHYCLDACCHPIVSRVTGENSLAHNAMESEFDRFLLERRGIKKPHSYNRGASVRCGAADGAVIGRFYPEAEPDQIRLALNTMGVVLGLLTIHAGAKVVLDLMGDPNPGLLMHKAPNPVYAGRNRELLDGYRCAAALYPRLVGQIRSHMTLGKALGEDFDPIFG